MKKRSLLFILTLCVLTATQSVFGQLNYNTLGATNFLGTYTDLAATGTVITTPSFHNANSAPQNIGFTFNYNGSGFTQFVLNTNGFIKLGNTAPSRPNLYFATGSTDAGGLFNSQDAADVNLLAAFNHELYAGVGTAEYRMSTTGTAPSRMCTIQFKNVRDTIDPATAIASQYDDMQFQIILYETTNVIDFVYGTWTASVGTSALKLSGVGLKGSDSTNASTLVVTKTSTSAWSAATFIAGNYPANSNAFNFGNINGTARPAPDAGRTLRFTPMPLNDAMVANVFTLGNLPIPWGAPRVDSAIITNMGTNAMTNIAVTLNVTGATTFSNTKTISSLARGASATVGFAPYTPTTMGSNTVTVTIPADDVTTNNSGTYSQTVGDSVYSYADSGPLFGSVGAAGYILNRYICIGNTHVNAAKICIGHSNASIGKTVYAILLDAAGNKLDSSAAYVITVADTGKYVRFEFPMHPAITNSVFYLGMAQNAATFSSVAYQREVPTRMGAYYIGSMANPSALADFGGPGQRRRFMIQAIVGMDLGIVELAGNENRVTAFPNPSSDATTFSIKMDHVSNVSFSLYDATGKLVKTASNINTAEFKMEKDNLKAGVYFYKFNDSAAVIGFGKLVIE
jgi:hypothetical protein